LLNAELTAPLLKPHEAAVLLRLSPQRLAAMRLEGSGPTYIKAGRSVLYSRAAIESWIERNTRRSTSDARCVAQVAP
jgi:hypothetical protein